MNSIKHWKCTCSFVVPFASQGRQAVLYPLIRLTILFQPFSNLVRGEVCLPKPCNFIPCSTSTVTSIKLLFSFADNRNNSIPHEERESTACFLTTSVTTMDSLTMVIESHYLVLCFSSGTRLEAFSLLFFWAMGSGYLVHRSLDPTVMTANPLSIYLKRSLRL
jgi:hypothetical protein